MTTTAAPTTGFPRAARKPDHRTGGATLEGDGGPAPDRRKPTRATGAGGNGTRARNGNDCRRREDQPAR